jgi:hypothetical protein
MNADKRDADAMRSSILIRSTRAMSRGTTGLPSHTPFSI